VERPAHVYRDHIPPSTNAVLGAADLHYLLRGDITFCCTYYLASAVSIMVFKIRPTFGRQDTASCSSQAQSQAVIESVVVDDKGTPVIPPANGATGRAWSEGLDDDAQLGVRKAQATTLTWTKTALYTTLSW
jgi:hypothetical protein